MEKHTEIGPQWEVNQALDQKGIMYGKYGERMNFDFIRCWEGVAALLLVFYVIGCNSKQMDCACNTKLDADYNSSKSRKSVNYNQAIQRIVVEDDRKSTPRVYLPEEPLVIKKNIRIVFVNKSEQNMSCLFFLPQVTTFRIVGINDDEDVLGFGQVPSRCLTEKPFFQPEMEYHYEVDFLKTAGVQRLDKGKYNLRIFLRAEEVEYYTTNGGAQHSRGIEIMYEP